MSRVIGDHFARFGGHLSKPPAPDCVLTPIQLLGQFPLVLPKNEILAESEFAAPTITKLIPILFSTSGAFVAYNVNPVADQFQRAFQTSTFCNRLYSFFNKRWFFDQVLNDFLVRSFLRFGYEVSFEALDKGAIEILGPYGISYTFRRLAERISQLQSGFVVRRVRYDPWPPAWWGAAPPLWVNGKPDSTNPRKGCTAVVRALRPELFVVLAGMQVNESHPLASEVLTLRGEQKSPFFNLEIFRFVRS